VAANRRNGLVVSESSGFSTKLVVSDWSGGVDLVCGMKRGMAPVRLHEIELAMSTNKTSSSRKNLTRRKR
jgi:hypothetical protein